MQSASAVVMTSQGNIPQTTWLIATVHHICVRHFLLNSYFVLRKPLLNNSKQSSLNGACSAKTWTSCTNEREEPRRSSRPRKLNIMELLNMLCTSLRSKWDKSLEKSFGAKYSIILSEILKKLTPFLYRQPPPQHSRPLLWTCTRRNLDCQSSLHRWMLWLSLANIAFPWYTLSIWFFQNLNNEWTNFPNLCHKWPNACSRVIFKGRILTPPAVLFVSTTFSAKNNCRTRASWSKEKDQNRGRSDYVSIHIKNSWI